MIAALAMSVALATATHLTVVPWTGKDLATTTSAAAKFKLTVTGAPNASLRLEATHVADGWLGAFCTPKVCAPERVDVTLPASGQAVFSFELIREDDKSAHTSGAVITAGDASVTVPATKR